MLLPGGLLVTFVLDDQAGEDQACQRGQEKNADKAYHRDGRVMCQLHDRAVVRQALFCWCRALCRREEGGASAFTHRQENRRPPSVWPRWTASSPG